MNNYYIVFFISALLGIIINDTFIQKIIKNQERSEIYSWVKRFVILALLIVAWMAEQKDNTLLFRILTGFIIGLLFTFPRFKKKDKTAGQ
jgi:fructose-specific phosphotransferase system IIC component